MSDVMAEVLAERGLVEVFAIKTPTGEHSGEQVPLTRLAFYDPETKMFFTRETGSPIANNPEDSARNTMAVVDANDSLTGSPNGLGYTYDLELTRTGRAGLWARPIDDSDDSARWPEYRREHEFPWCAIASQESPRYSHMTGLAIYWDSDTPCVISHEWLWDTHQKTHVDPNSGGDVTLLGRKAPRDMLRTDLRGPGGLAALRLFYAGLVA